MSIGNGPDLHPFFMTRNSKSAVHPRDNLAERAGLEFNQNQDRRKRQRTASPEGLPVTPEELNENEWADQLRAASCDGQPSSDSLPASTSLRRETAIQDYLDICSDSRSETAQLLNESSPRSSSQAATLGSMNSGPARCSDFRISSEINVASPPKKVLRVRPDGKLASPKAQAISQEATPRRKGLRIRSDGKLVSPSGKEDLQDSRPRRTRKSMKLDMSQESLVVTIKYGNGNGSRSTIGCKLNDILSGRISLGKFSFTTPAGPPKATHPFFLGGTSRALTCKSSVSCEDPTEVKAGTSPPSAGQKGASLKRSRVTSKPPDVISRSTESNTLGSKAFGTDHARVSRFPGAVEPIWPPQDMLHIGRDTELPALDQSHLAYLYTSMTYRKLKGVEVKVPAEEEVLFPCLDLVRSYKNDDTISQKLASRDRRQFRRPLRRLMTNAAIQETVRQGLRSKIEDSNICAGEDRIHEQIELSSVSSQKTHIALCCLYKQIATSCSAFDKFECETQEWTHKYAPTTAEEVLQQGREAIVLRDWLKDLTTNSVEDRGGGTRESSISRKLNSKPAKRKRKRAEDLGDFVVSSDEDPLGMDEGTHPDDTLSSSTIFKRPLLRNEVELGSSSTSDRAANAIVITGPHGSGKTAAVYAVARELGFEVFEINAGSRRSGKDILDKVGDMTRNHLVRNVTGDESKNPKRESEEPEIISEDLENEIRNGRQGTMNNFFKARTESKNSHTGAKVKKEKASPRKSKAPQNQKTQKSQKQSLILLEEVDVLFEEDKMFWTTTLNLIMQSKRPVIMTATDEAFLPLDDMTLFAILRFATPPTEIAIDYLLLIACNEGHLLSRKAISSLFRAKKLDLRASIMELNFFCQMAVGDTKGGLDWMLLHPDNDGLPFRKGPLTRVVSEGTYQNAMGYVSGEECRSYLNLSLDEETRSLLEVWNGWGIDIEASEDSVELATGTDTQRSKKVNLDGLQDYDLTAEALSTADTFPASVCRKPDTILLDTSVPELTDHLRSNYTEGSGLLLADNLVDHSGVTESLALTLRVCARRLSQHPSHGGNHRALDGQCMTDKIPEIMERRTKTKQSRRGYEPAAFEPIARSSNLVLGIPKGAQISCFDSPTSIVVEDMAPYVRSIVSYDVKLKERRRQLSSLLLGPGQDGKKGRTTRSSRAALEGGQKALTRREKWFPNDTNFDWILRSGGSCWQIALQRLMTDVSEGRPGADSPGRSSVGSAMESHGE